MRSVSGKVGIIRVKIRRNEGRPFECVTREFEGADALKRADIELRWWARTAPRDGSVHKCTYWVTWEDDEVRADTYRLTYEDRARASIGAHVLAEDDFWAGRRSKGLSEEHYASHLARWSDAYDDPTRRAAWIDARSFE